MTNKDFENWIASLKPTARWGYMREAVLVAGVCLAISYVAMQGLQGVLYVALQVH